MILFQQAGIQEVPAKEVIRDGLVPAEKVGSDAAR